MDGNKKITGILFTGIIALSLTACKVQTPGYVGLYVDNLISVTDTTDSGVTPRNIEDTAMAHVVDTTVVSEAELPAFINPDEEILKISSDSVYRHEVEKMRKAITDSVQLLRNQMIELQKQLIDMPDTNFAGEKPQKYQPPDSKQTMVDFMQPVQDKNDTNIVLRKQLNEMQNAGIINSDTVNVERETGKSPIAESQQTEYQTQQMLRAKDKQIQMLQNRLNVMQNATARTPQPTHITSEPAQVKPLSSQQTNPLTLQMFQAQKDTIQFLKSQLRNLQLHPPKRDSVYIEKEAKKLQPAKVPVAEQKTPVLQALQDDSQVLKTRVPIPEVQTLSGRKVQTLAKQDEKDVSYMAKTDTTLIVAFYGRGQIIPLEEESVLKQIKALSSNKNVTKITLSGYTDSSGNAKTNKQITNKRLDYLSEKISQLISEEKIFFQNFGDVFATDTMVDDERRIEIKIHTK